MPTPVLATKLLVPAPRPRLVARSRLIQQLDAALVPGGKLALISAPAGFGKTTLVGDWIAHSTQRHPLTRVAWLSLNDGDNDPSMPPWLRNQAMLRRFRKVSRLLHEPGEGGRSKVDGSGKIPWQC